MLRLAYYPLIWKFAQIIMAPKPGKPINEVNSHRPISLLPKLFEKLLLTRIKTDRDLPTIIPDFQFVFRKQHSTVQQTHRIVNKISARLKEKSFCTAAFLNLTQALIKHDTPDYYIRSKMYYPYYLLLNYFITERHFEVKYHSSYSNNYLVRVGVPQSTVLGLLLYLIYTSDLPTTGNTTITTFADYMAVLATNRYPLLASQHLQSHLDLLKQWTTRWKITIN